MSDEADAFFEQGKGYFENNQLEEAINTLAKVVRLAPNRVDYRVWYTKALVSNGRYNDGIREADQIIHLDPKNALGFRYRGFGYYHLGDYPKAIEDYSRMIEIDPEQEEMYRPYYWRGKAYYKIEDWRHFLSDKAWYYKLGGSLTTYTVQDDWESDLRFSFNTINSHMQEKIWPELKKNEETLIEYWPLHALLWNRETKQIILSGTSFTEEHGLVGSGYICLTDRSLRIVVIKELSHRLEKHVKGGCSFFLTWFWPGGFRIKVGKTDEHWVIPFQDIETAQTIKDTYFGDAILAHITTARANWSAFTYENYISQIITGIAMARSHEFFKDTQATVLQSVQSDIVSLLKQLRELRDNDLITEEEFNEKKKELLSRL